jgi:3-dehydroquinate synthase
MSRLLVRYPPHAARSRVVVTPGAFARLGRFVRETAAPSRALVLSDPNVAALYGACAVRMLERAHVASRLLVVPAGERSKGPRTLERIWSEMAAHGVGRHDALVALGGGVVGDLGGFAAATWLRGVAWVGVPTSLLAQVDSSVGGKTGIDLGAGKNLVGAFHQPAGVLVDPDLLQTLPVRERRAGLAEVVKVGMATDAALFRWIEREVAALDAGTRDGLGEAVERAIRAKLRVVRGDEREREGGRRTALNYGHTLGHALEAARGYRGVRHGEAVAIGMRVASALSVEVVALAPRERARLVAVLDALRLPRRMPPTPLAALLEAMAHDKKRGTSGARWVLTPRVGHASVPRLISGRLVQAALREAGAVA